MAIETIANTATDVVIAVAAAATAIFAWRGLNTWRHETTGKRKLELAEYVLADFYKAEDVMRWVRSPGAYAGEGDERPGIEDETEEIRRFRSSYFVPIERINKNSEFFAEMRARRYRVMAVYGADASKPYDDFEKLRTKVIVSSQMLVRSRPDDTLNPERRESWEEDIGWGIEDEIAKEIAAIVKRVEEEYRPIIEKAV